MCKITTSNSEFLAASDVKPQDNDIIALARNMKVLIAEWLMGVFLICLFVVTAISVIK